MWSSIYSWTHDFTCTGFYPYCLVQMSNTSSQVWVSFVNSNQRLTLLQFSRSNTAVKQLAYVHDSITQSLIQKYIVFFSCDKNGR